MTTQGVENATGLRIWFVRHGRTLFNELGLAQGWCDSPLTEEGRTGVAVLADKLADVPWAGVYSSTSERAMDTAEILVGDRHDIVRDRRWKEYNFGIWEAKPNQDVFVELSRLTESGDDARAAVTGIFRGDFPALEGGETGAQYGERVAAAIADIRAAHTEGDVLVVTHGMTVAVAATQADPRFDFGTGMDNATFTMIEYGADDAAEIRAIGASSIALLEAEHALP